MSDHEDEGAMGADHGPVIIEDYLMKRGHRVKVRRLLVPSHLVPLMARPVAAVRRRSTCATAAASPTASANIRDCVDARGVFRPGRTGRRGGSGLSTVCWSTITSSMRSSSG